MTAGLLAVLLLCAQQAAAERVYVTRGDFGEASFSDVALPGARAIDLEVRDPRAEDVLQSRQRAQITADLAAELADARHARAQVRARQRAAAEVQRPATPVPLEAIEVRYLYPYTHGPFLPHPGIGSGRGHLRPPQAPPLPAPEDVSSGFKSKWLARSANRQ